MRLLCIALVSLSWVGLAAAQQRIISMGGGVTETVYALGHADAVIAIDTSSPPPQGKQVPRIGYVRTISAEGVLALKPDLIVAPDSLGPPTARQQLQAAGVKLEVLPEVKSVAGAIERIIRLGAILNAPEKAKTLAQIIRDADTQTPAKANAPKVLFLFVHGSGPLQAAGKNTRGGAAIEAAGGINAITAYEGYRPLSPEAAVAAQPDILLTTERALKAVGGAASFWRAPGLALTPAGKTQRVIVMNDLALLGFGTQLAQTLKTLHAAFYP